MPAKQVVIAAGALVLLGGVANAGPCSTTSTTGSADQEAQRQEHTQPAAAEQPKSAGTTGQSDARGQAAVPSSKMTDTDQSPAVPLKGSETSSKMADQDC
jgi:hypothetical protein